MNVRRFLAALVVALAACKPQFNAGAYSSTDALYAAGVKEFNAKHWENATRAFERLTNEQSPRDPKIATAN